MEKKYYFFFKETKHKILKRPLNLLPKKSINIRICGTNTKHILYQPERKLKLKNFKLKMIPGALGWLISWGSGFHSGHELKIQEFNPCIGSLCQAHLGSSDPPSLMLSKKKVIDQEITVQSWRIKKQVRSEIWDNVLQ